MSDLEDDTIRILTALNVIKMPAYCWYLSANASRLWKSLQISAKSAMPCCLGRETQCCQNLI